MKKLMLKLMILSLGLVVLSLPLIGCGGAKDDYDKVFDKYGIRYYLTSREQDGENTYIYYLSEPGSQIENQFVLAYISEIEVKCMKERFKPISGITTTNEIIKKLYIPGTMEEIESGYFDEYNQNLKVYYAGDVFDIGCAFCEYGQNNDENGFTGIEIIVPKSRVDRFAARPGVIIKKIKISAANVVYDLNAANMPEYYYVDDVTYGDKITNVPPDPTRKSYKFTGWYTEKECINKWDFDNSTLPALQLTADGEVVFQQTTLYAGWKKTWLW